MTFYHLRVTLYLQERSVNHNRGMLFFYFLMHRDKHGTRGRYVYNIPNNTWYSMVTMFTIKIPPRLKSFQIV